ncbi:MULTISPECIES: c-type cytochrome [Actibacterium]|uniref:Mono/diheme cytochrome c family protein n=1 Tax=Actibacterium naphthalenivorans TaxID=1614693 RepID=A0A840CBP9_9RHOB|nr:MULTISPECIES: cytochrome c [Actibacterium]ALG90360.1 hypothetical protein TQ29_09310 [Actibacterium sp. EMB200-NS6]MBB4022283.1 mono/diheme cytochrome c family protein [Actibacterium naphthalenivorans]
MRRALPALVIVFAAGLALFWWITAPGTVPPDKFAGLTGDRTRGEQVFWAAGCASCHAAENASGDDKLKLGGGQRFPSDFGTFRAPNISPDPRVGIGGWSVIELANAMMRGVSPEGAHYYPAFPYTSYANAAPQDVVDLKTFLDTLPPVATPSEAHELSFPFTIRRLLGGWKFLFANKGWVMEGDLTPELMRGRYLVEALGHCGECHTPRNALGGARRDAWLGGAPNPGGQGTIPNITPARLTWSAQDIAYYLETGFTPEFDTAGGHMAPVIENLAKLPAEDRAAIAAYLKAVPPVE